MRYVVDQPRPRAEGVSSSAPCPACGALATRLVLEWPSIPTNSAIFPASLEEAREWPLGSLRLAFCEWCSLLFNESFDARLTEYTERNVEAQAVSPHFRAFATELARDWRDRYNLRGRHVLEVGPGHDAAFLRLLCEETGGTGTGIGPSVDVGYASGPVELVADVFDDRFVEHHAAALICRHTLEHISDIRVFLGHVAEWAARNPDSVVLFEVPESERILRETAFWDVYYEHCSYFTRTSLQASFETVGLSPLRVRTVYGLQYLVIEAKTGPPVPASPRPGARRIAELAESFAHHTQASIQRATDCFDELARRGPVLLWQAGSKAVALLTSIGNPNDVTALVDLNPEKHGHFVIGTGHPIVAPEDVASFDPAAIVVMNESYVGEISRMMASLGVDTEILSIKDALTGHPLRRSA